MSEILMAGFVVWVAMIPCLLMGIYEDERHISDRAFARSLLWPLVVIVWILYWIGCVCEYVGPQNHTDDEQ